MSETKEQPHAYWITIIMLLGSVRLTKILFGTANMSKTTYDKCLIGMEHELKTYMK